MLHEATRERAKNPPKPRWRELCETFHDNVRFKGTAQAIEKISSHSDG
jgi:hypothetical protein